MVLEKMSEMILEMVLAIMMVAVVHVYEVVLCAIRMMMTLQHGIWRCSDARYDAVHLLRSEMLPNATHTAQLNNSARPGEAANQKSH